MRQTKKKIIQSLSRVLACLLLLTGCVTSYKPARIDQVAFLERSETKTDGKMEVTIAVLSDKEAEKLYGVSVAKKGIQPVWVSIKNGEKNPYILLMRSIDPDYFSPDEAAYVSHFKFSSYFLEAGLLSVIFIPAAVLLPYNYFRGKANNKKMDEIFATRALKNRLIKPGETSSGFVYTTLDEGVKNVQLVLYSPEGNKTFDFTVTVPGITPDHTTKDFENRYSNEKIEDYDEAGLSNGLKELPCCTSDKKDKKKGDPINLVMIGELEDLLTIFAATKWDETETLTFKSGLKMAKALFTGTYYRYSPVSSLYIYGHSHDVAFQKIRSTINERLHLRLWYTPLRFQSKPVWVGTISRDIGVRMTWRTWYLTTHKIDANLDDARDYLLEDLIEAQKVRRYGFLRIGDPILPSRPEKNLTGDSYFTDNMRVVIETSASDTEFKTFPWNHPLLDNA